MKKILLFLCFPLGLSAQDQGVHFEHGLTWNQVKAKAKAENKYIFLDCVTTWCKPCKWMADSLFPTKEAGDFFNRHFVNVKVQMNQTTSDNEEVKNWYEDAKSIARQYPMLSFPTFLYFSPDGKLVHKAKGGEQNAAAFIRISADALDTATQFYTLLEKVSRDPNPDPSDLRYVALFAATKIADAKTAATYYQKYMATQKNMFTKDNIEFVRRFTLYSPDSTYQFFLKNVTQINTVMGDGFAEKQIRYHIQMDRAFDNFIQKYGNNPTEAGIAEFTRYLVQKYPEYGQMVASHFTSKFIKKN